MQTELPLKRLRTQSWVVTIMFSLVALLYLSVLLNDFKTAFLRFWETIVFMGALCFTNVMLLARFYHNSRYTKRQQRILFYGSSYVVSIVIWMVVKTLYSLAMNEEWEGEQNKLTSYPAAVLAIWLINTMVVMLHRVVLLQYFQAQSQIENLQLKANISEHAHLLLRQQTQPHFLFNALNTIKALYKQDTAQGEAYLVHLANFLRVSLNHQQKQKALIKDEMEICYDYLNMQKIRFGEALRYSVSIGDATAQQKYVPFFSLQPLIENAIKHNDLTEEKPISIAIYEQEGWIVVANNLQEKQYKEISTGVGLSNLAERYRLLTGDAIDIQADGQHFLVSIKILDN